GGGGVGDDEASRGRPRRWISSFVIGLNLCPFARRVFDAGAIRYVVSDAEDEETLLGDLAGELAALASSPISTVETTLLIHPRALRDVLHSDDFLRAGDRLVGPHRRPGGSQLTRCQPAQ